MQGALKYIEQRFADAKFSEIFYQANDTAGKIENNFAERDARCVLLHFIYWVNNAAGGLITWTDQFGAILFSQNIAAGSTGWAPIPNVVKGQQLRITCSSAALSWSLSYQYIM